MKKLSLKIVSLIAVAVLAIVVSAGNATIPDEAAGIGTAGIALATNSCAGAPLDACSADLRPSEGIPDFGSEPSANCSQSMRCHGVADCPDFHPIGCVWVCSQHCCVLSC